MNQLVLRSFYQETQNSLGIHYCCHGCGKLAFIHLKYVDKWSCSKWGNQCPKKKERYIGKNNHFYGKHHSKELKEWFSKQNTGYKFSEEVCAKRSESQRGEKNTFYGKKHSAKTKAIQSAAKSGPNHPWYGKYLPASTKEKISKKSSEYMLRYEGSIGAWRHVKTYDAVNIEGEKARLHGTWEVKMAEFLNSKKILWKKGKGISYFLEGYNHLYTPDFYLPLYDKYIEVKGYYPEKCKTKMAAVLSQNKVKLFMAFKREMDNLEEFIDQVLA